MNSRISLKPNCLITRRPLKLVTSPRSIFHYQKPWDRLPEVLYEHGYKESLFQLPFRDAVARNKLFLSKIHELNHSHVVVDEKTYQEFLSHWSKLENATITIVSDNLPPEQIPPDTNLQTPLHFIFRPNYKFFSISYWLHQKYLQFLKVEAPQAQELFIGSTEPTWYRFIDHCVHLAELDFLADP